MKSTAMVLALAAAMLLLPACGMEIALTPEAELLAARKTFTAAVRATTVIREKGGFTKSQGADVSETARYGLAILDEWEGQIAVERQQGLIGRFLPRVAPYRQKFREVLVRLATFELIGKRYLASQAAAETDKPKPKPPG